MYACNENKTEMRAGGGKKLLKLPTEEADLFRNGTPLTRKRESEVFL